MTPNLSPAVRLILSLEKSIRLVGGGFSALCSLCLAAMLVLTATTVILRPFGISYYWIFPWVMVLFVWLSFFGFFAAMIFARDIRIDFVARQFGEMGMLVTRIIGQIIMLFVLYWLLVELPSVVFSQSGNVDGALLPWGGELQRKYLSLPLLLSCLGIAAAVIIDIFKMLFGLPETLGGDMHNVSTTGKPV
jgi:TRAP-type C4-dicarboxylate transport system permease small subunit